MYTQEQILSTIKEILISDFDCPAEELVIPGISINLILRFSLNGA